MDTSPYVHLSVRYTGVYARPQVGAKIFGKVQAVSVQDDKVTLICYIEAELTAIVNDLDTERFLLRCDDSEANGEEKKRAVSSDDSDLNDDDDDDNDSIFGGEEKASSSAIWHLEDSKKANRRVEAGSKVKLQITDV